MSMQQRDFHLHTYMPSSLAEMEIYHPGRGNFRPQIQVIKCLVLQEFFSFPFCIFISPSFFLKDMCF